MRRGRSDSKKGIMLQKEILRRVMELSTYGCLTEVMMLNKSIIII